MTTSRRSRQMTFDGGSQEPVRLWMTPKAGDADFGTPRTSQRTPEMSTHLGTQVLFSPPMVGCSPPATPASRSATPGSGPARMTPGTSGRGFSDCLPRSTPTVLRGFVWKMSEDMSAWGSTVCSLTWTTSATPQRRGLFLLRASARSTVGTGCGSSDAGLMLPTPDVPHGGQGLPKEMELRGNALYRPNGRKVQLKLHHVVERMWPTPRTEGHDAGRHRGRADSLHSAVKTATGTGLYPTPDASGEKFRLSGDSQQSRCLEAMARRGELDGTPPRSGQKLNPAFVSRLMGYPDGWLDLSDSDPA